MDFLERLFGWAPDGGDGTLELMLLVTAAMALVLGVAFRGRVLRWVFGGK
ncbi:MAG: hypothetical protein JSR21_19745 [Proteobacteria bacterium]|nr:hypothetical protein [Pseudomonadota bacterium]